MLSLHTRIPHAATVHDLLVLPFDQRERCRQRARLASGEEVALFLARGTVLRDGDLLTGEGGRVVRVVAAPEPTYLVRCRDATMLARCAFHLGNRHTQTQVGPGWLRIRIDPVLREMVEGLGAQVDQELAKFEPEAGAYAGGHGHGGHGGHHHDGHGGSGLLAPVPVRQKIHRPDGVGAAAARAASSVASFAGADAGAGADMGTGLVASASAGAGASASAGLGASAVTGAVAGKAAGVGTGAIAGKAAGAGTGAIAGKAAGAGMGAVAGEAVGAGTGAVAGDAAGAGAHASVEAYAHARGQASEAVAASAQPAPALHGA